jgi:DNA-binding MarR family transcriptional regulator
MPQRPLRGMPIKSIYAYMKDKTTATSALPWPSINLAGCNCLALRQAARHVTQIYDQFLAPSGLRATQYSILARLQRKGPMTINALAAELVMDRTTLGRNILPLEREGIARFRAALKAWQRAQHRFEAAFGTERAEELRALLQQVVASEAQVDAGLHA